MNDDAATPTGVTFPLMKKSDVNGANTNGVYKWLKEQKSGLLGLSTVKVRLVAQPSLEVTTY